MTLPALAMRGLVTLYRRAVSPFLPPTCRYLPTCSEYAYEAISRFGAARGGWLALRRVLRCHPLGGHGYDPLPQTLDLPPKCSHLHRH